MDVDADTSLKVKHHPLLDTLNSPEVAGVVPGSLRTSEDVVRVDARLRTNQQFTFSPNELSNDGALVGSHCELVVVGVAKKSDGTDIGATDPISLREEASSLVWRDIALIVNGVEITHAPRADIIRHVIDRYHQASRQTSPSLTEYRQLGNDSQITAAAGTPEAGLWKEEQIRDGLRFELIRPLDDLPMFAAGDSLIPGFNVIQIRAQTTSEPQALFKASVGQPSSPYILVEEVKLRYTSVKLEQPIAQELQQLSAAGELEINGNIWSANNLTPRIEAGARRYTQGVAVAFGTVPDVAYFMAFPESTFVPPLDAYESTQHPLLHTWAAASQMEFIDGSSHTLRQYRDLENIGGKTKLLHEMGKALASQGGVIPGTGALSDVHAVSPTTFVLEPGLGAFPLIQRNWAEMDTLPITPISIRVRVDLNDPVSTGAPENAQPYLVSKTRHRWVLSTTSGGTKLIV